MTDKPVALEFPIELEFRNVDFCEERKSGEFGENPSEQGRGPISNSAHLLHLVQDLNPGHIGGGERDNHCTTPAPLRTNSLLT